MDRISPDASRGHQSIMDATIMMIHYVTLGVVRVRQPTTSSQFLTSLPPLASWATVQ